MRVHVRELVRDVADAVVAGTGAIEIVDKMPMARPFALRYALPESPGTPGRALTTVWLQPLPSSPRLVPRIGLSVVWPMRSSLLP